MKHEALHEVLSRASDPVMDRYALSEELGQGAFGMVWRARDAHFSRDVAIKFIGHEVLDPNEQWREASTIRRLGLATGARLLDEGVYEGFPFIVMELIEGDPFPGPLPDAGDARDALVLTRARDLLLELSRLHTAGIVHADLKPNNALVERETGRVVLLDFGLSSMLGARTRAKQGQREGTPLYMSPEQLRAQPGRPTSDLYAVGVILFEILTGHPPHDASSLTALMRARLMRPAPAILDVAPAAPESLARLIDALLERDANLRPISASRALEMILEEDDADRASTIPLEEQLDLDSAIEALREGKSLDVGGRTIEAAQAMLDAILARLTREDASLDIRELSSKTTPYASLIEALSLTTDPEETLDSLERRLREALATGADVVLVSRDPSSPDAWSGAMLEASRRSTRWLRVVEGEGDLEVRPLSLETLERLFIGPEAGYRMRSDAAHELFLRTGGWPDALERELDAWRSRGLAWQSEHEWTCERSGLDWLAQHGRPLAPTAPPIVGEELLFSDMIGWIGVVGGRIASGELAMLAARPRWEVEALLKRLAERRIIATSRGEVMLLTALPSSEFLSSRRALLLDRLPESSTTRVRVLLEHDDTSALVDTAIEVANDLDRDGFGKQAITLLEEAALTLRQREDFEGHARILHTMTQLALATPSVGQLESLLRTLSLRPSDCPEPVRQLVELARESCRKPDSEVISALDALGVMEDPTLELRRRMYMGRAGMWCSDPRHEAITMDAHRWAREEVGEGSEAHATTTGWLGQFAYTQGRYREASEFHAFAAAHKERRSARIASLINRAWSLLDGDLGQQAASAIEEAIEEARACNHYFYELQALQLSRWIAYRNGDLPEQDDDLLEAITLLGNIEFEARTFLIEAAVSWRRGELDVASDYARRGADCWQMTRMTAGSTLCQALAMAIRSARGEVCDGEEHATWCARAVEIKAPLIAAQSLGLLASIAPLTHEHAAILTAHTADMSASSRAMRREVISVNEALEMARISA